MAVLSADVRDPTGLRERRDPGACGSLLNRFYRVAREALIRRDAIIDKLIVGALMGKLLVSRIRWAAATLGLAVVFAHYVWTASSSGNPFQFGEKQEDYYNLLADALLAGQLHLKVSPDPALLRLPDPYDPKANAPYRTHHDVSLFRGKYYLYFGVAPVLTLFIPCRVLTATPLPEGFAAALFMFGGLVLSSCTIYFLWSRFYGDIPPVAAFLVPLFLGFSNFAPFILRRPAIYEIAVSAGFFFLSGAILCLVLVVTRDTPSLPLLALASLGLGLALGSRPQHFLSVPLMVAVGFDVARRGQARHWQRGWPVALAVGLPVTLCLLGVLAYNHARFGAWLEFGQTYILGLYNHPRLKLFSTSYLPSHLFIYFLVPPSVDLNFPFFHLYPGVFPSLPHGREFFDPIAGLLPCVPLAGLALLSPVFVWSALHRAVPRLPALVAVSLAALGLAIGLFLSGYLGASARYFADFCPPLLLSAAITWLNLDLTLQGRLLARVMTNLLLALLLAYGTVVNLAVGLTGPRDLFRKGNPAAYAVIEDRFLSLQRWLLSRGPGYGNLRMTLRFPERAAHGSEALLTVGSRESADVLCVRYLRRGRAEIRFRHREGPLARSPVVDLAPGRARLLEVSMGSLFPHLDPHARSRLFPGVEGGPVRRLSVKLDGLEVIAGSYDFKPSPSLVAVARNPVYPHYCPAAFSGEVLEVRQPFPAR